MVGSHLVMMTKERPVIFLKGAVGGGGGERERERNRAMGAIRKGSNKRFLILL